MTQEQTSVIQRLPKVELHLHLDCSLSYNAVSRLEPSISRDEFNSEFVAPARCPSLADFLRRPPRFVQLLQTAAALRIATEDVFNQLAADNVVYAELRFAPLLHMAGGLRPADAVAAVDRATEDCIAASGIEARIILCTLRHFSSEQSMVTAQLAKEFRGSRVVALDIAGDEAGFPLDPHVPAFQFAHEQGIARTAHAGEASGAGSVWTTVEKLYPTRIGHGVRSIEDPLLVDHLRSQRIHLELCPSSNAQTAAWPTPNDHPVERLLRDGVSVSVSTDTRTITQTTLFHEYALLQKKFLWSAADFKLCNRFALEAAFVDEKTKRRLSARMESPVLPD